MIRSYDEWKRLGYQVKKGENAAKFKGNIAMFSQSQVQDLRSSSSANRKKDYRNVCYKCSKAVNGKYNSECKKCGWLRCRCGACGCDYKG